jgi:phage recombination protein Bet
MSALIVQQAAKLAKAFSIPETGDLVPLLKATAFKRQVSDAQMSALLIVANQYGLNPWTKEIYAFPDNNNGIVPVVGVDGWARIINENSHFDGMDFQQDDDSCTCIIYRKDRSHPIKVTEYLSECKRGTQPWQSHPRRMLRHKAMIQCARLAFGYVGIYDQDEAERIVDVNDRPRQNAAAVAAMAQAEEVLDDETRGKLLADLEAVADTGLEALQESWQKLQKHERKALANELEALKDRASKVISE